MNRVFPIVVGRSLGKVQELGVEAPKARQAEMVLKLQIQGGMPKTTLKMAMGLALIWGLTSCTYVPPGSRVNKPEVQCDTLVQMPYLSVTKEITKRDCQGMDLYKFDLTQFSSNPEMKTKTEMREVCFESGEKQNCVWVSVSDFNTEEALKNDPGQFAAYNYQEFRVHLKDPNEEEKIVFSKTAATLKEAFEAAQKECFRRFE